MRTSKQIVAEIEERCGFLPPFFAPAQQNPQVLETLWQQTLLTYIDNPLPTLFKEKLAAYLSRYCAAPYCIICHSCTLHSLGMKASEVLNLLESPPPTQTDIDEYLRTLVEQTDRLTWQEANPDLEQSLLYCSIFIALEQDASEHCRQQLRQILGAMNYQHLVTFIAYIRTYHEWMVAYPEVAYGADKRAIDHLDTLLEDEPGLVNFFHNYQERVGRECQRHAVQRVGMHIEITNRKQAQEALDRSQTRFQKLVANLPGMVYCYLPCADGPDQFTFVNSASRELLELEPEIVLQNLSSFVELIHPDDLRSFQESVATSSQNFLPWQWEGRIITPSGQLKWIQGSSRPEPTAEGDVWDGLLIDITERKQTEVALHQLTVNLESLVAERTAQLQQALEFEATLKRITDKVRDSLDESQILQTVVQELAVVLGATCCNTALYNIEKGSSTICYEYATLNPQAQARTIQIEAFPEIYQQILQGQYCQFCSIIPNPIRGRVAMLTCPIIDDRGVLGDLWLINQPDYAYNELEIRLVQQVANQCAIAIRQAQLYQAVKAQVESLQKLNALKDDFLSTVSHELRTPLSNMKMALSMLKLTRSSEEKSQRYLEILTSECNRETELVNDLLDLQRLEAESYLLLPRETVSLQDFLPSIIAPFQVRIGERQQLLQIHLPPDLPELVTDRTSLERILVELLNNACKYTPAGGEIIFSVDYKSAQLTTQFCISNTTEIPAAYLLRIFDKFYRIPNADPWRQGGTGLGLALVQKLVNLLKGTISVESSGGWTTFTLELFNQPIA